jgi:hypothetical protein
VIPLDVFVILFGGDVTMARRISMTTDYEQYCYNGNRYLYFQNDVLTSIQK